MATLHEGLMQRHREEVDRLAIECAQAMPHREEAWKALESMDEVIREAQDLVAQLVKRLESVCTERVPRPAPVLRGNEEPHSALTMRLWTHAGQIASLADDCRDLMQRLEV